MSPATPSAKHSGRRPEPASQTKRRIRVNLKGYGPDAFTGLPQDLLAAFMRFPWRGVAEMKVALAIAAATYQDRKHWGEPVALSYGQIATATNVDRRWVKRYIRDLEGDGVLEVGRASARNHAHEYQLGALMPPVESKLVAPTPPDGATTGGAHAPSLNSLKNSKEVLKKQGPVSAAPLRGAAPPSPNGRPQTVGLAS